MVGEAEFLLDGFGKPVTIRVMQLHVERLQPAQTARPMRPAATVPTAMPSRS